ncbi:Rieske (2Fe-2S) protein [Maricaulis sp.]|jgi:nitrite reductase/ring-hydroxylating ferredoxin subunit|uniref:Rieske (2Fe-2S) protein n=1 Tax=Maricaulis sp. TaxID=1486257 RepID=UPI00260E23FB|nr:Rieske (2Fe-2S) protein [Maricaulis sp.]
MRPKPPPGTELARLDDLPDPGARAADWESGAVLLVRRGDTVTAWANICPHAGMPLTLPDGRGLLHKGETLVCPAHGASFDATGGACTGGPAADNRLTPVAVEIAGGIVYAA